MTIEELNQLKIKVEKCANCGSESYDSCYSCRNHRISDGDILFIINELISLKK